MSTYKVIQDIEAEDHILGPFSLRQFIYLIIACFCFYFCYLVTSHHAAFLIALFLPPGLFTAFFAVPFGRDQPTEIWALAKIRFMFKPRRRIWDQSGVKELVTVTAPKRVEEARTDGLSENEVRSRLSALANTIDSRGWAIKNVNVNMYARPSLPVAPANTDRLVSMDNMPQAVPDYDIQAADDIMDEQNNPIAHQFDQMITDSEVSHRQKLQAMMSSPATPAPAVADPAQQAADYWFLNQQAQQPVPKDQAMFTPQVVAPGTDDAQTPQAVPAAATPTEAEAAIAKKLKEQHNKPNAAFGRMKTILPLDQQKPATPTAAPTPNPATVLARDNDKNIDVIAREAKRINHQEEQLDDGEVVISLH